MRTLSYLILIGMPAVALGGAGYTDFGGYCEKIYLHIAGTIL